MASTIYAVSFVLDTPDDFVQLPPLTSSDTAKPLPDFATWLAVMAHTAVSHPSAKKAMPANVRDAAVGYVGSITASGPNGDEVLKVASGLLGVEDLTADDKVGSVLAVIAESIKDAEGRDHETPQT